MSIGINISVLQYIDKIPNNISYVYINSRKKFLISTANVSHEST